VNAEPFTRFREALLREVDRHVRRQARGQVIPPRAARFAVRQRELDLRAEAMPPQRTDR
jgi:hypothetical protein